MTATITPTELRVRLEDDPSLQLLDVRSGAEFESAHIPGSVNVPLDALTRVGHEIADTDGTFVLVCQSGGRADQAHTHLRAAGKDHLMVLDGGITAWQHADGPLNRGTQRWAMDRQVRLVAGSLVLTGIAVSLALPQAKWLAGAVGAGLTYSAVSNSCAMATVLSKLPYNQGPGCDIDAVVAQLTAA
ncbi:MAG: rhodanese-like domain-containing protein [Acidimicrobiia bacterium]|nr:rhodanese-like domain-containing protein [Acidimicrobiia bacterium]MDH5238001.1 rhodanese-like domain-containing protein [Acidimicrobiia bacterium]